MSVPCGKKKEIMIGPVKRFIYMKGPKQKGAFSLEVEKWAD